MLQAPSHRLFSAAKRVTRRTRAACNLGGHCPTQSGGGDQVDPHQDQSGLAGCVLFFGHRNTSPAAHRQACLGDWGEVKVIQCVLSRFPDLQSL